MKNTRFSNLIPVAGVVALLVSSLMAYAGFLTSDWIAILASAPAILAVIGIVGGMLCGMFFFEDEEEETPAEASRPDGAEILDRLGSRTPSARVADLVHRTAIRLHVHGMAP
jgi:hypothetical protein